jgi:hypothetical protein
MSEPAKPTSGARGTAIARAPERVRVTLTVNAQPRTMTVEPRMTPERHIWWKKRRQRYGKNLP